MKKAELSLALPFFIYHTDKFLVKMTAIKLGVLLPLNYELALRKFWTSQTYTPKIDPARACDTIISSS